MKKRPKTTKRQGKYVPRVIVKFINHIGLPYDKSAVNEIEKIGIGSWKQLSSQFRGITFTPLFSGKSAKQIRQLISSAVKTDPTYQPQDLLSYFAIRIPSGIEPEKVLQALSQWRFIETTYVEPSPTVPPLVNAGDDPRSGSQGYLDPAPDGIDAEYAWDYPGGAGAGQALVDLEWGWNFNHEDLVGHGLTLISGINHSYFFHGTAVLGEIAAIDNTLGCVGIAPEVHSIRCVGQWLTGGGYSTSQPILDAINVMEFGDILLLEAQTSVFGYFGVPVEIEPAVFDVIRLATALGIVVIEAAGNGGTDLDTVTTPFGLVFNRLGSDFRDSGAIMVGASTSLAPHSRWTAFTGGTPYGSSYGSRVDCYAWGENISTLDTDPTGTITDAYTTSFSGTSGASGIITGAALAVQGLAEANLLHRFSPWQMRVILSDPAYGTPSENPTADRIGVMPDLRAIINGDVLNLAPDVYMRDFVGDSGEPHTGPVSISPDVILHQTAVADPQASFGEGSGAENLMIGAEIIAGQDNFIYVRVRNRGGSPATNVNVTVYWSPVSTLVTPDLWTLVGSTVIGNVPVGNILTVSDAITWPAVTIPEDGHYCFVAIIGHAQDPAPIPTDFLDFDTFIQFISVNNNITWRNFNVVNNAAPPGSSLPEHVPLPFIAPGAPDKARIMELEVVGFLPESANVLLEVPKEFAEMIRANTLTVKGYAHKQTALIPINPHGKTRLGQAVFPAKVRIPMKLLVHIPEQWQKSEFEIYIRQLSGEKEAGRVTWRLVPSKKKD